MINLRNKIFWLIDFLKGNKIRKDLIEIGDIFSLNEIERDERGKDKLIKLLQHATKSTEFYNKYLGETDISNFPVIEKNIIRSNLKAFISDRFSEVKLASVTTSGSTGTPFRVFHNKRKVRRNSADTIYFAGLTGFELGHKLFYLKIWAKEKMRSKLIYKAQNLVPVDVIKLDSTKIQELIQEIKSTKGTSAFLGYVSALEQVCRYLENNHKPEDFNFKVSSIITMSESINDYVKKTLSTYFKTKVYSRYSNLENGIIAQQTATSDGMFLINEASYIVKIYDINSDEIISEGKLGRIVVTDLYNYAQPMIKYDTGDLGSIITAKDGKKYLNRVEGRKLDMLYDTKGEIVSSYIMYKNMWKYTEILQYQLIQKEPKKYLFKINHNGTFNREQELVNEFKSYLGLDADFRIEYVKEIPLLNSGKRRKLVNEMMSK